MTAVLSAPVVPSASSPVTHVEVIRCRVGEDVYCLEMSAVGGVNPARDMIPANNDDTPGVVGRFQTHGGTVPVYDLANLLGSSAGEDAGHYVVLVDHPTSPYGLRVDSVSRVIRLAADHLLPLPKPLEGTKNRYRGIADFTRMRNFQADLPSLKHLPGLSEPKQAPDFHRRSQHQMQLLLNPESLVGDGSENRRPALPKEPLAERFASANVSPRLSGKPQLILFPIGTLNERQVLAGLSLTQIVEITEPLRLVSVPGAMSVVSGFIHWRNCPVPVIDFPSLLGVNEPGATLSHLLILRNHQTGELLAFPAVGRIQSLRLPIPHQAARISEDWANWIRGAYLWEERLLVLPNLITCANAMERA